MRRMLFWAAALMALEACGAERVFNPGEYPLDRTPPGFRSFVFGGGGPGDWKVIADAAPSADSLTVRTQSLDGRAVLAQLSRDGTSNRFAMLVFEEESYGDFKLTAHFKIAGGVVAQMAGVVFHFQNESNFYLAGGSALGGSFWCSKVADGELKPPIGAPLEVGKGVWHTLGVECEGTRMALSLDGKEAIKLIDALGNHPGRIGFWTRADSIGYFRDLKVVYARHEGAAQKLLNDTLKEYRRLIGLRICAAGAAGKDPIVVASNDPAEIGQPAGKTERDVISRGTVYSGKRKDSVLVSAPVLDRNGDPIAAVCVIMKSFPGQTEDNAVARAQPVVRRIQARVQSLDDLLK